jgi:hypothetical protein
MIGLVPAAGAKGNAVVSADVPAPKEFGLAASAIVGCAKSLPVPAAKLLASDVRKNFRRDHSSMSYLLDVRSKYTVSKV